MDKLGKEILFIDGAMGTILQEKGLNTLPEIWNITNSQEILNIHSLYVSAGCNMLKTNTFGANRLKLKDTGYTPQEIVTAAVNIAKKAAGDKAKVALDIGPTGKLLKPIGDLDFEEAVSIFGETIKIGTQAGADLILIETMGDTYEIKAAIIAAKENSTLPFMVTFSPDENGRLLTGADILTAATLIEALGACAIGLNCGTGPSQMMGLLKELCSYVNIPVIFNPNGGLPQVVGDKTVFDLSPTEYAQQMKAAIAHGAAILGGCCGTTPAHIGAVASAFKGMPVTKKHVKPATKISSYGQTVVLGNDFAVIGERINPTGKPRLKQALREKDMGYIYDQAISQIEQGAKLLDVNVGLPGIDEAEMLPMVVANLQSITPTPLVIDTSNPKAAEAALRVYNGKPLLNSVNGKDESLNSILPIAKKYGASLVALTLDDNIPETADGRINIAEKIVEAAEKHGIKKHDLIIDALTMTIGTNSQSANITLGAIDYIHNKLGICTTLGLSNISFGLPMRELLNAGFLSMALNKGLSSAIANPANEALMNTIYVYNVLSGKDENCIKYVHRFAEKQEDKKDTTKSELPTLYDAVIKGLGEEAKKSAELLLKTTESMEIINTQLIPALDTAGKSFGSGKTFLPQLLMSASAAKSAFEAIRLHMAKQGDTTEKRGKIILATVKGDIHDIGKNIVKTLLENYNFHVIDMGKDVEPEAIAEKAISENIKLVGLSALMTTTVVHMEETIKLLNKKAPQCKIMVGGAVLTESYAKEIGANFYSPDAMGSVKYATALFGEV